MVAVIAGHSAADASSKGSGIDGGGKSVQGATRAQEVVAAGTEGTGSAGVGGGDGSSGLWAEAVRKDVWGVLLVPVAAEATTAAADHGVFRDTGRLEAEGAGQLSKVGVVNGGCAALPALL